MFTSNPVRLYRLVHLYCRYHVFAPPRALCCQVTCIQNTTRNQQRWCRSTRSTREGIINIEYQPFQTIWAEKSLLEVASESRQRFDFRMYSPILLRPYAVLDRRCFHFPLHKFDYFWSSGIRVYIFISMTFWFLVIPKIIPLKGFTNTVTNSTIGKNISFSFRWKWETKHFISKIDANDMDSFEIICA